MYFGIVVLTFCEKKNVHSSDREKLLKFEAEGKIFEITGTIYRNNERSEQYIRSNILEQLELGLIRIIQIGKNN